MQFYEFGHNSSDERGWTWAPTIYPRSKVHVNHCDVCGRHGEYPEGAFDVNVEGGSSYPDILGCGAYPLLIVSDKVTSAWNEHGITSFQKWPVGIAAVHSKTLAGKVSPRYFHVEVTGKCVIDLEGSGIQVVGRCPGCGTLERRPNTGTGYCMSAGSWDGSDLFRDAKVFPRVLFCTQRVLDVAAQHDLTNFRFVSMEEADRGDSFVKYRQRQAKKRSRPMPGK
jgi:hypothetical protein